jgi:hypothetical protein
MKRYTAPVGFTLFALWIVVVSVLASGMRL